jgi:hypothetical protein
VPGLQGVDLLDQAEGEGDASEPGRRFAFCDVSERSGVPEEEMSLEVFGDEGDVPRDPLCEWCEWEMQADDDGPAYHCNNPDCPGDPDEQE